MGGLDQCVASANFCCEMVPVKPNGCLSTSTIMLSAPSASQGNASWHTWLGPTVPHDLAGTEGVERAEGGGLST